MAKNEEVADSIDLRGIPLSGFDFRVTVQEDDDGFSEDIAIFSNIHFEGATLRHCNFEGGKIHNCYFENADLSHSEFNNTTFNTCNFQESDLSGTDFHGAKLISCDFLDATIKDVAFDSTIIDQKTNFGKILKSEKEKNFHFASIEYRQITEMYKNSSLNNLADKFHYKELIAKRKNLPLQNPYRLLSYVFGDLLSKYGTSYLRIFGWVIVVIVGCAAAYFLNDSLLFNNDLVKVTFADSLYFSISTFTTLGYGDYHAIGWMRFLAGFESFVGVTLMSLFTVIATRKIIRD